MKSVSSHRGIHCFIAQHAFGTFYMRFTFTTMQADFALSSSHGSIWIVGCYWCLVLSCTDWAAYGVGASRFAQHAQKNDSVFAGADRHWCWEETCKGITVHKISVFTIYLICFAHTSLCVSVTEKASSNSAVTGHARWGEPAGGGVSNWVIGWHQHLNWFPLKSGSLLFRLLMDKLIVSYKGDNVM